MYVRIFLAVLILFPVVVRGQQPQIVNLKHVTALLTDKTNQIQVVNFWATWCAPCVKELPLFEKLHAQNLPGVKVTLISLDLDLDPNPEKVFKFVTRKNLTASVLILDEKDPNTWIDKISSDWSGALPATIVVNTTTGSRKFLERELHEGELEAIIAELNESKKN